MKKVFIVIGPESSGTKIVTRLLCMAGCAGDYEHEQRLDKFVYEDGIEIGTILGEYETIVLRRSIPHSSELRPDIQGIGAKFQSAGFEPYWIVVMRDWCCNAKSKVSVGYQPRLETSKKNLVDEWTHIGSIFVEFDGRFYIVLTSCLFTNPERVLGGLEDWVGFSFPNDAKKIVFDADKKYY